MNVRKFCDDASIISTHDTNVLQLKSGEKNTVHRCVPSPSFASVAPIRNTQYRNFVTGIAALLIVAVCPQTHKLDENFTIGRTRNPNLRILDDEYSLWRIPDTNTYQLYLIRLLDAWRHGRGHARSRNSDGEITRFILPVKFAGVLASPWAKT